MQKCQNENRKVLMESLVPVDSEGQKHLSWFLEQIPDSASLCWSPSAGSSFWDLLLWKAEFGFDIDVFVHTDYFKDALPKEEILFQDDRTTIRRSRASWLSVVDSIQYNLNPDFADIHILRPYDKPRVQLMDVEICSDVCGTWQKSVLFFYFENINWFEEFVLKKQLTVTHMFKVREGLGFGGNRKSISLAYPFLGDIGCRWLVCDPEVHVDEHLWKTYLDKYPPKTGMELHRVQRNPFHFSDMKVSTFIVSAVSGWSTEKVNHALSIITQDSLWKDFTRLSQ